LKPAIRQLIAALLPSEIVDALKLTREKLDGAVARRASGKEWYSLSARLPGLRRAKNDFCTFERTAGEREIKALVALLRPRGADFGSIDIQRLPKSRIIVFDVNGE
jgi:hypothetical protein